MAAVALTAADATPAPSVERQSFDPTFVTCFIAILMVALVCQLLMLKWRPLFPGAEGESSLIGGAKAAAGSIMSFL
jgi:hypothetical protein